MGALILLVAGYFAYAILSSYNAQKQAARFFQPVEAVVTASRVRSSKPPGIKSARTYSIQIEYSYMVNGRKYSGHRFAFLGKNSVKSREDAQKIVDRYPAGRLITVYYKPENPAEAIVYNRPPESPPLVLAIPFALFGLTGLIMLVYGLRRTKARVI